MSKGTQERLIIFTEGFTTASEICRDWKAKFAPQTGDYVELMNYDLYGGKEITELQNRTWKVIGRTVTQDVLFVHLVLLPKDQEPYV